MGDELLECCLGEISVKGSKSSQNRGVDTSKKPHLVNYIMAFPSKKRGTLAHQQQDGWVYLILMPRWLNN